MSLYKPAKSDEALPTECDRDNRTEEATLKRRAYESEYRARNREKFRESRRLSHAKHRDEANAYAREYWRKNGHLYREKRKAYAEENRESILAAQRRWNAENRLRDRLRHLLISAKRRASRSGKEFSITSEDLTIPDICPVLGIPIEIVVGKGRLDAAPSIDRIDNSKGYVPGNVRIISARANAIKRDMTLEEAQLLVLNWSAR